MALVLPLCVHPCIYSMVSGTPCTSGNPVWLPRSVLVPSLRHGVVTTLPQRRWVTVKAHQTRAESIGGAAGDPNEENSKKRLEELADALSLPTNFLSELPKDLRTDLKAAAFVLSNGAVSREVSRAWETGDTESLRRLTRSLSSLRRDLPDNSTSKAALGKRLVGAGNLFKSTGQYGDGELQKIGKALIAAGEAVAAGCKPSTQEAAPESSSTKVFKFGTLQLEISSSRAFIGAAIAVAFGLLSWHLTQSLQGMEDSTTYANDSATAVATSLRGGLLALGYSSSALSAVTTLGLLALGLQLRSGGK